MISIDKFSGHLLADFSFLSSRLHCVFQEFQEILSRGKRIFICSGISQRVDLVWPLCVLLRKVLALSVARCKLNAALPPTVLQGSGIDDGEGYGPQGLVAKLSFGPFNDDIFSRQLLSAGCFLLCFTDHPDPGPGMWVRKIEDCLAWQRPRKTKG